MIFRLPFIALLFFGIPFITFSQKHALGLKTGGNTVLLSNAQGNITAYPGFDAGVIYRYQFNKRISVQVEPGFSSRKFRRNEIPSYDIFFIGNNRLNAIYSVNYFSIPIFINYDLISTNSFRFKVNTGFVSNITISGQAVYEPGMIAVSKDYKDGVPYFRSTMFELPVGLAISMRMSKSMWFTISPRMSFGLTEIGDRSKFDLQPKAEITYADNTSDVFYTKYKDNLQKEDDIFGFFEAKMNTISLLFSVEKTF